MAFVSARMAEGSRHYPGSPPPSARVLMTERASCTPTRGFHFAMASAHTPCLLNTTGMNTPDGRFSRSTHDSDKQNVRQLQAQTLELRGFRQGYAPLLGATPTRTCVAAPHVLYVQPQPRPRPSLRPGGSIEVTAHAVQSPPQVTAHAVQSPPHADTRSPSCSRMSGKARPQDAPVVLQVPAGFSRQMSPEAAAFGYTCSNSAVYHTPKTTVRSTVRQKTGSPVATRRSSTPGGGTLLSREIHTPHTPNGSYIPGKWGAYARSPPRIMASSPSTPATLASANGHRSCTLPVAQCPNLNLARMASVGAAPVAHCQSQHTSCNIYPGNFELPRRMSSGPVPRQKLKIHSVTSSASVSTAGGATDTRQSTQDSHSGSSSASQTRTAPSRPSSAAGFVASNSIADHECTTVRFPVDEKAPAMLRRPASATGSYAWQGNAWQENSIANHATSQLRSPAVELRTPMQLNIRLTLAEQAEHLTASSKECVQSCGVELASPAPVEPYPATTVSSDEAEVAIPNLVQTMSDVVETMLVQIQADVGAINECWPIEATSAAVTEVEAIRSTAKLLIAESCAEPVPQPTTTDAPPADDSSSQRIQIGDVVTLGLNAPSELRGSSAVVTKAEETASHCTVVALDEARKFALGECWPNLADVSLETTVGRLYSRVVIENLTGAQTRRYNGHTGTVSRHPREGHPSFITKPSKRDAEPKPLLVFNVRLDNPPENCDRQVLLELRFLRLLDGESIVQPMVRAETV